MRFIGCNCRDRCGTGTAHRVDALRVLSLVAGLLFRDRQHALHHVNLQLPGSDLTLGNGEEGTLKLALRHAVATLLYWTVAIFPDIADFHVGHAAPALDTHRKCQRQRVQRSMQSELGRWWLRHV